jgi:hypothetical protein
VFNCRIRYLLVSPKASLSVRRKIHSCHRCHTLLPVSAPPLQSWILRPAVTEIGKVSFGGSGLFLSQQTLSPANAPHVPRRVVGCRDAAAFSLGRGKLVASHPIPSTTTTITTTITIALHGKLPLIHTYTHIYGLPAVSCLCSAQESSVCSIGINLEFAVLVNYSKLEAPKTPSSPDDPSNSIGNTKPPPCPQNPFSRPTARPLSTITSRALQSSSHHLCPHQRPTTHLPSLLRSTSPRMLISKVFSTLSRPSTRGCLLPEPSSSQSPIN